MQKCAIEMALIEISLGEFLLHISEENFNNFYRILYGSGDVKRICLKLDELINNNVQDDRLEIKRIILDKIAGNFHQYFVDIADYKKEITKYSSFDDTWHFHKLWDSSFLYACAFANFLKGLEFNKQKDLLRECFDLAFNILGDDDDSYKNDFANFIMMSDANNFDELLGRITIFLIRDIRWAFPKDYLQQMQTLTQLLRDVKHFLLKKALHERGFINLQSGENLSYFVHFTDEDNLDSILANGILSRKEIEKRGIASKTNDEMRLDGALDYISISITHPNDIVLKNFINKGSIKKPIYICLDPFSVLSRYGLWDIIFCDKNAAASACEKGNSWLDFENIFAPSKEYQTTTNFFNYNRQGKEKYEPTDPQAEILIQYCIPKNAIAFILDSNGECIFERKR